MKNKDRTINWVCNSCGMKYGKWYQGDGPDGYIGPSNHCATYHLGVCDVCKTKDVAVTEPRDFGQLVGVFN